MKKLISLVLCLGILSSMICLPVNASQQRLLYPEDGTVITRRYNQYGEVLDPNSQDEVEYVRFRSYSTYYSDQNCILTNSTLYCFETEIYGLITYGVDAQGYKADGYGRELMANPSRAVANGRVNTAAFEISDLKSCVSIELHNYIHGWEFTDGWLVPGDGGSDRQCSIVIE